MSYDFALVERKQKEFLHSATPRPHSVWRHYKGDCYVVHGLVMKESTEELEVCYSKIDKPLPLPWSGPLSEWNEIVQDGENFEGRDLFRSLMETAWK
jgi:hypothetical protein